MRQIILASGSPRRKEMIKALFGDNFKVHVSKYEENNNCDLMPIDVAKKHALGKARDVAKHYKSGIVIAGDVFVVFNNEILGKPKDEQDAFLMLKKQQGKQTQVISGLVVIDIDNKKEYIETEITNLQMAELTDKEILRYIKTGDPMDKAGSFGMRPGGGAILVEKVVGCYSNVVGLPLTKLHKILREIGVEIFNY